MNDACVQFITKLPAAELHVHIEGTMEPELYFTLAKRNNITVNQKIINKSHSAYLFSDINSFINAYHEITKALCTEQDFYDIMYAYLQKASQQGIIHVEVFFDLQTYTPRNVAPDIIINGLHNALLDGKKHFGITGNLIMCFLRHLSEENAFAALELLLPYKDKVIAVGLASFENGNPPSKFEQVFTYARDMGFKTVAHAGEEPRIECTIKKTLSALHVKRIDHGVGCMKNKDVIQTLIDQQIPLTVCPLSNIALGFYKSLTEHPLKKMLDAGLMVTINSDDPAFFGGHIKDNYRAVAESLSLSCNELVICAENSIKAAFISNALKNRYLEQFKYYVAKHSCNR
jgi:adenosine deaminase